MILFIAPRHLRHGQRSDSFSEGSEADTDARWRGTYNGALREEVQHIADRFECLTHSDTMTERIRK
jgi:hypothetical protein